MRLRAFLQVVPAAVGWAHEPITTKLTWTKEISRIVYQRCVVCHRDGGKAPMSLVTYEEVRPWAKAIREEVHERRMPPWGAVKGFGEFRNDASLSEREIELIANWVEGGAPKGDDIYLPPRPPQVAREPAAPAAQAFPLPVTLDRAVTVVGIEPAGPGQVTARRRDGSVAPLLWLLHRRPEQPKAYYYLEPIRLPRGTAIEGPGRLLVR